MSDFLEMMFGGGSPGGPAGMSPSQEMNHLAEEKAKRKESQAQREHEGYLGRLQASRGGSGGGGQGQALMGMFTDLLASGANPRGIQALFNASTGVKQNPGLRSMFNRDTWDPSKFGLRGANISSTGTGRGGMMMPQAPAPERQSQARLDLNDFYERRRERAGMQDQLNFRKQLLQQIMGSIGGGGGQIHESGMHEQLFNNAGAPRAIPLRNESTRDMTPQERASLISAMLQGF